MSNLFRSIEIPVGMDRDRLLDLQQKMQLQASTIFREFDVFQVDSIKLLDMANSFIQRPYTTDPQTIKCELADLTSISASIGQSLADANSFLTIFVVIFYTQKQPSYSEADRKLQTELRTLIQENLVNKLKDILERLDKRITVFQSILKNITSEMSRGE